MIEKRITGWLADFAIRRRKTVFLLFAVLTAMGLVLSQNLGLVVEPEQLLGKDNAVANQFFEIDEAFGFTSNIMITVEGEDREEMVRAAHAVSDRIRADRELSRYFSAINLKNDAAYPLQWGLILADEAEDVETTLRLLEQRSLLGFLTTLNDTLEEVVLSDEDRFGTNQDQWNGLAALSGFERLTAGMQAALAAPGTPAPEEAERAAREIMESVFAGEQYSWSPDQDMLLISLLPAFDVLDFDSLYAAVHGVEAVTDEVAREFAGVNVGVGGELAWGVARHEGAGADTLYPTLVALVLIVVLFFFSFTRMRKMALALLALVVGILITVGGIVLTVGHISMITSIFAVILMGLGIDFGIHLVSNYDDFRLKGMAPSDAMRRTMEAGGTPIMLGGVTTACAFFSLALSRSPAVAEFGIVAGMGVLITLATMLTLFPALVLSFGGKRELSRPRWRPMIDFSFMGTLGRGIQAHPWVAIGLSLALTAGAIAMIPRNVVDFDPMNNAPRNHPYTLTQQRIIDRMEISPFISLSTRTSLEETRELTEAFRRERTVSRALSVADLLPPADEVEARLALIAAGGPAGPLAAGDVAGFTGEDRSLEDVERLADEIQRLEWNVIEMGDLAVAGMGENNLVERRRNLMVREIFGAEVGEPGREVFQQAIAAITADPQGTAIRMAAVDRAFSGVMETQQRHMRVDRAPTVADLPEDLRNQLVSIDGSRYLITVFPTRDTQADSAAILAFHTAMTGVDPGVTGSVPLYVELVTEIFSEATRAGAYVAAVVFVLLLLIFRRLTQVILAFAMVVLGIVWMFGLLPLTGTHLGLTAGLVFPLLIGIGTDDAMHILHRYNHEGGDIVPAIRYSGKAVLLTTVTTMLAFGSLAVVGEMATIAAIGWLLFVGLGTCFVATVILLPACLTIGRQWRQKRQGINGGTAETTEEAV
ncbi:MAG: hypothetical protein EA427_15350 [Spirochaetaceae bacterium]|nr:MAG: hypothetical protein EA427_15350 [Spirochaetaceae bacterium]